MAHVFTLKISNHAEHQLTVDFQNKALSHVAEQDASLPIPRVIPARNGQLHASVNHDGQGPYCACAYLAGWHGHAGDCSRSGTGLQAW